jgi:hypothetical protein
VADRLFHGIMFTDQIADRVLLEELAVVVKGDRQICMFFLIASPRPEYDQIPSVIRKLAAVAIPAVPAPRSLYLSAL